MPETARRPLSAQLSMWLILALGFGLRFYHLETPSQWWDEILVPLTASHPLAYILDFCRSSEMHPPLFYFVVKGVMALGVSDFALRFVPALLGVLTLYALYLVSWNLAGQGTALLAMAFMAVNGLNILVSREIRPYSLQIFALTWTWFFLIRLQKHGRWRDLAALCAINAGLFWLHYFTFHMVAAQFVALAITRLALGAKIPFNRLLVFALVSAALALPVFFYFFLPSSGSRSIFTDFHYSRLAVLGFIGDYLGQNLYFFGKTWPKVLMIGLCILGGVAQAKKDRMVLATILILAGLPLVNVFILGKAAYFSPWHVAYTAVFTSYLAAMGLAWFVPWPTARAGLAGLLVLALGLDILVGHPERFYQIDSYRHQVFVNLYKPVARNLAATIADNTLVTCSDPGFANAVGWYLKRFRAKNPFTWQIIEPNSQQVRWSFISAHGDFGSLAQDEKDFLDNFGPPVAVTQAENSTVYNFLLERGPGNLMTTLPFKADLPANPQFFYKSVEDMRYMRFAAFPGLGMTASLNDRPGVFHYQLENQAGSGPQTIFVNLFYRNSGLGNQLGLYYQFDDEPLTPLAGSLGPDKHQQVQAVIRREAPYKRLKFTAELYCRPQTSQYHGGNLETLAFRELEVYACEKSNSAPCQERWERRNLESLGDNYLSEGLLGNSQVRQRILWDQADNVADEDSSEEPGWRVLTPKDPTRPAKLRIELDPQESMTFFPRISGTEALIQVKLLENGQPGREVFLMVGRAGIWTPIGARYALDLPTITKPAILEITLQGRYAQLWHQGQAVIF